MEGRETERWGRGEKAETEGKGGKGRREKGMGRKVERDRSRELRHLGSDKIRPVIDPHIDQDLSQTQDLKQSSRTFCDRLTSSFERSSLVSS